MIIYLLQISVFHCTLYLIQAEHYHLHSNEPEIPIREIYCGLVILYTCARNPDVGKRQIARNNR